MAGDTTVVVTSCGRHDLLFATLLSFRAHNTDRHVDEILVVEDGGADPSAVCERFGARLLRVDGRVGQIRAIDAAYAHVRTPYIFHCEDDWEFFRSGFVERSRSILRVDPSTACVWLRAWDDTNGHPLAFRSPCRTFGVLAPAYSYNGVTWSGFTFNPGLRRMADYMRVGPYARWSSPDPGPAEAAVGRAYGELGFRAVILDEGGYVRHTGWQRHVGP